MRAILILSILIGLFSNTKAQVKTNFNNVEIITEKGNFNKNFPAKNPYVIPAKNIQLLLDKEAVENTSNETKPFKIAEPDFGSAQATMPKRMNG